MSDVPDEILREILSRLPAVPLLRFRCVSKSWKCLIDSQQFIKDHLNQSQKTNPNLSIILRSSHIYSADFDLIDQTNMAAFNELSHPLETPFGGTEILGSCDGLLVLRNPKDNDTILWNPSIRRFHAVPCSGIEILGSNREIIYGFGYDVVSDDYKLIRIVQFYGKDDKLNSEVKVYSLKSDSWRRIPRIIRSDGVLASGGGFPYYLWSDGVLANGALHWIVTSKVQSDPKNILVAAFDLGIEEFRLVSLPKFAGDDDIVNVVVVGGCLSLMCYHENEGRVDIWVMKEYGVQVSWSILFAFYNHDDFNFPLPLAYSKCGRKVLLGGLGYHLLMWYDLNKKSTYVPMVEMDLEGSLAMCTCLQSLVLLNNGACDFDLVTKKKQESKGQKEKL